MQKQKRTTNRKAGQFAASRLPFKASNLEGLWAGQAYVVLSYGWYPIYVYDSENEAWYRTKSGYSMSTRRQITEIHRGFDYCGVPEIEHEELKAIVSKLSSKEGK